MDPEKDTATLEQALSALREQYGAQATGPMQQTQVAMRRVLEQKMGVDELLADRLVKKLCDIGKLTYVGADTGGGAPGMATLPGATMPAGQGAVGGPAAGVLGLGAVVAPIGAYGSTVTGTGAAALSGVTDASRREAEPNPVLRGGDTRKVAEEQSGATMGQLADTNVEGGPPPAPETIGERQDAGKDDTQGYWRIG